VEHFTDNFLTRREAFRLGRAAASGYFFLPLLAPRNVRAARKVEPRGSARFCLFFMLDGGQSHVDGWDLKEGAWTPQDFEATTLPTGIKWPMALYPKLAARMDKFTLIRSAAAWDAVHGRAQYYVQAAHPMNLALKKEIPPIGAVAASELEGQRRAGDTFPPYVAINVLQSQAGLLNSGFLPAAYSPFLVNTNTDLTAFSPDPESKRDLDRRWNLLLEFDGRLRTDSSLAAKAYRDFHDHYKGASRLMADPRSARVFDLPAADKKRYGNTTTGDACILARNLIHADAGTRFIFLQQNGWDHHSAIYERKNFYQLSWDLDAALSSLLDDLSATQRPSGKTLLDETLIFCLGEFGRTPGPINGLKGRDHYPTAYTVLTAGGGTRGGKIIGQTDGIGAKVVKPEWQGRRPVYMEDIATTVYSALGIDWTKTITTTPSGREFYYVEPVTATTAIASREIAELYA